MERQSWNFGDVETRNDLDEPETPSEGGELDAPADGEYFGDEVDTPIEIDLVGKSRKGRPHSG